MFFPHLANEEDVLTNNSAPQCLPSVSWFSPEVVSYLSSGGRELYEAAKQNMCFLKSLFNVKSLDILPLMGQLYTATASQIITTLKGEEEAAEQPELQCCVLLQCWVGV